MGKTRLPPQCDSGSRMKNNEQLEELASNLPAFALGARKTGWDEFADDLARLAADVYACAFVLEKPELYRGQRQSQRKTASISASNEGSSNGGTRN